MKMPEKISNTMFASCGVNCQLCYRHLKSNKKNCHGCFGLDENKTVSCANCKIKLCLESKQLVYCFQCDVFPCKWIKNLEKSYKHYGFSIIENSVRAKDIGIETLMKSECKKWTCALCGGIICANSNECTGCNK